MVSRLWYTATFRSLPVRSITFCSSGIGCQHVETELGKVFQLKYPSISYTNKLYEGNKKTSLTQTSHRKQLKLLRKIKKFFRLRYKPRFAREVIAKLLCDDNSNADQHLQQGLIASWRHNLTSLILFDFMSNMTVWFWVKYQKSIFYQMMLKVFLQNLILENANGYFAKHTIHHLRAMNIFLITLIRPLILIVGMIKF